MPRGSSPKRERQYDHIKSSARERGESEGRAEQIAARTVNKQRARSGEAKSSGAGSERGSSAPGRGGQRSRGGPGAQGHSRDSGGSGRTYRELYDEARRRDIRGRSSMDKAQLEQALSAPGGGRK